MMPRHPDPVVHLELHTPDLEEASAFCGTLFGWQAESVRSYMAMGQGRGVVQCSTPRPLWLPYVEVPQIRAATERAVELGASVLLSPREGPLGWRSVVSAPAAGQVALWQQKR